MSDMTIDDILAGLAHAHETQNEYAFFDLFRQGSNISQTPEDWQRFRETLRGLGVGEAPPAKVSHDSPPCEHVSVPAPAEPPDRRRGG